MKILPFLLLFTLLAACTPGNRTEEIPQNTGKQTVSLDTRASEIAAIRPKIEKFYKPMVVQNGDWLQRFPENGQTFEEYISGNPTLPDERRNKIYIQPIGTFNAKQREILAKTSQYLQAFFGIKVVLNDEKPFETLSVKMYRRNPSGQSRQVKTGYFLNELLPKLIPKDAAAFICFSSDDLYPDENWAYVFGQANLQTRVGVWSFYRLERNGYEFARDKVFLRRVLKVAMHETGHMFSIAHCVKYECVMSGVNHLGELDRHPIDACPEDLAKIVWGMKYDAAERLGKLAELTRNFGLDEDAALLSSERDALLE